MDEPKKQPEPLSREEIATLIKETWAALLAPDWARDDLIELGKTIYAKVSLSKIDDRLYARLLPQLVKIAECLGLKLRERQDAVAETFKKHMAEQVAAFEKTVLELDDKNQKIRHDLDVVTSASRSLVKENQDLQSEREQLRSRVDDLRAEVALLTPTTSEPRTNNPPEKENG